MSTLTPAATYPVGAPFNTATPYSGTFIPQVWSAKLQSKFYDASTFAAISNTDYQGEIKNKGDKVIIRTVPTLTINAYTAGSTLNYEVPQTSLIELNIDKGYYFGFQVNDVLEHQADINLMETFSNDASEQLRTVIDRECIRATFSQCDAANMGATAGRITAGINLGTDTAPVALTSANVLQTITSLATVLDEQNIPNDGRFLVISPYDRQLLINSDLADASWVGDSQSAMRNGRVGMIDRFEVYISNMLPKARAGYAWDDTTVSAGTAKRRAMMAGHRSAITFAAQITKTETLRNPSDFGDVVRSLQVYGRKVIVPKALALAVVV